MMTINERNEGQRMGRKPLLLQNGMVVDGTGRSGFGGDVLVRNGRIAAVGPRLPVPEDTEVIDCRGRVVAPGFIDMHSHNDWFMAAPEHDAATRPFLHQGITTFVTGNCGFSAAGFDPGRPYLGRIRNLVHKATGLKLGWYSVDEYFRVLSQNGLTHNLLLLAGHGTVRTAIRDFKPGPLDRDEQRLMHRDLETALEQGAAGVSLGLQYEPGIFAPPEELEAVARLVQRHDKVLTVHPRAFSTLSPAYRFRPLGRAHNLQAIGDMLALARKTGVRLQFSHLIFFGARTWRTAPQALALFDQARREGIDLRFDTFFHHCGASLIHVLLPEWFLAQVPGAYSNRGLLLRLQAEMTSMKFVLGIDFSDIVIADAVHPKFERYNGQTVAAIARRMRKSPFRAFIRLAAASRGQARVLMFKYSTTEIVRALMRHPAAHFMTDAWVEPVGTQNPSAFGAFPGFLQAVREEKVIRLEEAIHKMTGASAARFGLRDRGCIKAGLAADIVVFDREQVRDNTTPRATGRLPSGICHVLINGVAAFMDGEVVDGVRAGAVLRR
ncbi:MAG: amidohydrolase family protein [Desulfobacterales bacterium]|nr:amidohydrolase family protein [Desulfobacterales bacterium]